jgi:hypothetical protein
MQRFTCRRKEMDGLMIEILLKLGVEIAPLRSAQPLLPLEGQSF